MGKFFQNFHQFPWEAGLQISYTGMQEHPEVFSLLGDVQAVRCHWNVQDIGVIVVDES